jgi:hypothetical protein
MNQVLEVHHFRPPRFLRLPLQPICSWQHQTHWRLPYNQYTSSKGDEMFEVHQCEIQWLGSDQQGNNTLGAYVGGCLPP